MTLLAIANGTSDLVSGILATLSTGKNAKSEQQGIYLGIGGFVGSAVFISTVVIGAMILSSAEGKIKVSP